MTPLLLAPLVMLYLMFFIWPMVQVVVLSMQHTNFITTEFVGIDNYIHTLVDPSFWQSVINSLYYAAIMIPCSVGIGFVLACFVSRFSKSWRNIARIFFYIPVLSAGTIIAGFWKWLFHINGLVNWATGLEVAWFAQGSTAVPVIGLICIASTIGAMLVMVLSAIESIDPGMLDAARIDGASWGQIKLYIILPTVAPTLSLLALMSWVGAWQIIETPMMLAPQDYAATLTYHIYRQGFLFGRYGMASAQAVILLVIIGTLALVQKRIKT